MAAEGRNGEVSTQGEDTDPNTNTGEHSFDELARGLADGKLTRQTQPQEYGCSRIRR